ncbi:MAG: hypothetical protein ACREB8_15540, partial [Pseudolabrys sp.]
MLIGTYVPRAPFTGARIFITPSFRGRPQAGTRNPEKTQGSSIWIPGSLASLAPRNGRTKYLRRAASPMTFWLLLTVNSITFGGLLFLLAAGFSLIFGLMRIPNL